MTASHSTLETVYQIAEDAICRQLDDEVVVYLVGRFETHLLDNTAWQVLQALAALDGSAVTASLEALAGHLLDKPSPLQPSELAPAAQALAPVLASLTSIGVLTASTC